MSAEADAPVGSAPLHVVGIGGTTRPESSSAAALRVALKAVETAGARFSVFTGDELNLPMYEPGAGARDRRARKLVSAMREADGFVICSPGYHGGISGLIKNALDYAEDLRDDPAPYWHGRAVGCIVAAHGAQAATSTLVALRSVAHALRGWPTPLGVALNSSEDLFDERGGVKDVDTAARLAVLGGQVVEFAAQRRLLESR